MYNRNANTRVTVGRPQTGNMKTYTAGGIKHDGKHEDLNHRTHPNQLQHRERPDQLQHRQNNNFGK